MVGLLEKGKRTAIWPRSLTLLVACAQPAASKKRQRFDVGCSLREYLNMDRVKSAVVAALLTTACGPSIRAAVAYDAANDIGNKSQLAQADLKACKADQTQCDQVEKDLKEIGETSDGLKSAALGAGFEPGTKAATPAASTGK